MRAGHQADQRRAAAPAAVGSPAAGALALELSEGVSDRARHRQRPPARDPREGARRRGAGSRQGEAGARGAGGRAHRRRAQLRQGPGAPAADQGPHRNPREERRSAQARASEPQPLVAVFSGLELLATAVVALDEDFVVRYANPAAESLLATGAKSLIGQPFLQFFSERSELERSLDEARTVHWDYAAQNVTYMHPGQEPLPVSCVVTRIDGSGLALLAELRPIDQQLRFAREERLVFEQQ